MKQEQNASCERCLLVTKAHKEFNKILNCQSSGQFTGTGHGWLIQVPQLKMGVGEHKKSSKALLCTVTFPQKKSKLDKELLWPPQLLQHTDSKPLGLLFSVFDCEFNGKSRVGKISKKHLKTLLLFVVQSLTPDAKEEPV